ncbi:MAG: sigma-54 dependent transcriptional regulator [Anaerovorax sp.]|nr:sigma-54 dependent transcriptional regulator [Anaerovorax sp.]
MTPRLKLLIVDDEPEYRTLLRIILEGEGYPTDTAENGMSAISMLEKNEYDVVLIDMRMAGINGIDLLEHINKLYRNIKCIVITAYATVENAVEVMKKGAFSYFIKTNNPQELIYNLHNIESIKNISDQNLILKDEIDRTDYVLISKCPLFQKVVDYSEKAAKTDVNVLILGESGVGKEVIARHIHKCSERRNEIFMSVNCHSFSDSMLEAELYGHEKGAFTGSQYMRKGRFEAADKGTLFLDEIGDIPLETQVKILRNIENKEIERIGSNKTIKTDFRLISATNKNLNKEILNSRFREDLFYRISTVIIEIPPLRQRKEDLQMMIDYFLDKAKKDLKKNIESIDDKLLDVLLNYDYPGNVRELKNIIERMVVIAENNTLSFKDISQYDIFSKFDIETGMLSLKEVRQNAERAHIIKILESNHFDIDMAANVLQITSRQLYNKINLYNIKVKGGKKEERK